MQGKCLNGIFEEKDKGNKNHCSILRKRFQYSEIQKQENVNNVSISTEFLRYLVRSTHLFECAIRTGV